MTSADKVNILVVDDLPEKVRGWRQARVVNGNGDATKLRELAEDAKDNCPISKALKGNVAMSVEASPA